MNKKKSLYEAPTTDVLVVRFEEAILRASYGADGAAGQLMVDDDGYIYSL